MPKQIRENEDIYIAPDILGVCRQGQYLAIDERNGNIELNPYDIENKILFYERQVQDWFLNRATRLVNGDYNGFIVLMICMSYLEGVEQHRQGRSSNGNSNLTFRQSLNRMYPNQFDDDNLRRLYEQSRVGLFHDGMVRGDIIIDNSFASSIAFTDQDIRISPAKLLTDIKTDFRNYINSLKEPNNTVLRNNFNEMFHVVPQ